MAKLTLDISMSLDGFIAGPNNPRSTWRARPRAECTRVIESPAVTHLRYRVVK